MAKIKTSLLILSFAAFVVLTHWAVSPAREGLTGPPQDGAGQLILLAAARGGQNPLVAEREFKDALINDPPFTGPAPEPVAPAPPARQDIQAPLPPRGGASYSVPQSAAPLPAQPVYIPTPAAPPPGTLPEVQVRAYSMDPSGAINIIGLDGVLHTIDGSSPVKLIFPPEYGIPAKIVGGSRPAPIQQAPPPVEIAVRGYSIEPSGAINILGMDGVLRTLDGSRAVKLVFPPEYGLAPQVVGGNAPPPQAGNVVQVQVVGPGAGGGDAQVPPPGLAEVVTGTIVQEGIGALFRQIPRSRR